MSYTYTKEKDSFTAIQNLVGGSLAGRSDGSKMSYESGQKAPTQAEIDAELKRMQDEYDAKEYQRSRALEYPSIADQLDEIYHNGIDSWKAIIKQTKDKYPKG
tara:strand:- start:172 stop:480 length:309 start_codon:yes stop_codon:yes gene_type:complete